MEGIKKRIMNINWVLADDVVIDPTVDLARIKDTGSFWGSWKTWRAYNTDNVVCHDTKKAGELIKRAFHAACNFYIPNSLYVTLDRPKGVRLYEGDFLGHEVDNKDELVAINLAATVSDIVLLLGFDWSPQEPNSDQLQEVKARNYRGLVLQAIKSNPEVQWVLVDHPKALTTELSDLGNVSTDTLENVLKLLNV
jgi:hypothetical protein